MPQDILADWHVTAESAEIIYIWCNWLEGGEDAIPASGNTLFQRFLQFCIQLRPLSYGNNILTHVNDRPIARLSVAWPGVRECYQLLVVLRHYYVPYDVRWYFLRPRYSWGEVLWWPSLSVRLPVCPLAYLRNYTSNVHHIFMHVTYDHGSVLLWRRCDTLCTSGFMDDIMHTMSQNYIRPMHGCRCNTETASQPAWWCSQTVRLWLNP